MQSGTIRQKRGCPYKKHSEKPLQNILKCGKIASPHKFIETTKGMRFYPLVKMHALFRIPFVGNGICVVTSGAVHFSVRSFGYALFDFKEKLR